MEIGTEKIRQRHGRSTRRADKAQSGLLPQQKKQKKCAGHLNDSEHQNEIFLIAKQKVKERQDITGPNHVAGQLTMRPTT